MGETTRRQMQGLIFDVDGVLVDTVPLHYAAWEKMFSEYGYPFDERIYRERVDGKSRHDGVRGVMTDASEALVAEAGARKQSYYLEQLEVADLEPFPDAARMIERVASKSVRIAAASGSANAPAVLRKIGLLPSIDAVVTGADIEHGKPDPEIFLTAAQHLELRPHECIVFEDAEAGVEAANRGGFASVGVDRGSGSEYLRDADLVVTSLDTVTIETIEELMSRSER